MAKLRAKQADKVLYDLLLTYVQNMDLDYVPILYLPGYDAPRDVQHTRVYVNVERTGTRREPMTPALGMWEAGATLEIQFYATEDPADLPACEDTIQQLIDRLSLERCDPDLIVLEVYWDNTTVLDGRKILLLTVDYKYEA